MVTPHWIQVPDEKLVDTRDRIRSIRWSEILPSDRERYGVSVPELRGVLEHWAEHYSWRDWEERLNSHPHFYAPVDGVDLHFWHIRGARENSIPILLLHGWPGSAVEFWKLIGPLTDPAAHGSPGAPSFDVIIAELPGFGFSGKPSEYGWGLTRIADAMHVLVHDVLGYSRYGVHGEDWGSMVAARMARRHPNEIAALQITMPFTMPHGEFAPAPEWEARLYDVTGYDHMQAQVPDALTIGMVDSPLGLAAWVLEKFSAWSDNDGTLNSAFELDSLVTNLHFYWLNSSIMSATRIYREVALEADDVIGPPRINVPTSLSVFPKEPFSSPREWLEDVYDIRGYTVHESGGHFAALEQPDAVLAEIREFFPSLLKGAEK